MIELIVVRHESAVAAIPTAAGPLRLLEAGLPERLEELGAAVAVSFVDLPEDRRSNPVAEAFVVAGLVAQRVRAALSGKRIPLVLSGSCHTALGAVAGLSRSARGVVWLDCHGDFNTPDTTVSGLLDGTTLATITGRCFTALRGSVEGLTTVSDEHVLLIGVRDLDDGEEALLERSGVVRVGADRVRRESGPILSEYMSNVRSVYVHLDLDVLDPSAGRANAWVRPGGLSAEELEGVIGEIATHAPAHVLGIASFDPGADHDGRACEAALRGAVAFAEARMSSR